jgi:AcrR family transcriptional regulator
MVSFGALVIAFSTKRVVGTKPGSINLLNAARAAFAAEGSEASLDEIARRAGVGVGTVYRHFATKEVLFKVVVSDRMDNVIQERLAREGAMKRDLLEVLVSEGIHLPLGEAPIFGTFTDVLAELLYGAQRAGSVRSDVSVEELVALLTGAAYAIGHSRPDHEVGPSTSCDHI